MPVTCAFIFWLPAINCKFREKIGDTEVARSVLAPMAVASSMVSVTELPAAPRTPPAPICEPGVIIIRSAPSVCILASMSASAPLPMDINAITAETPITIPSIVNILRNLWEVTPPQALPKGLSSLLYFFILLYQAVHDMYYALAMRSDLGVVCNHYQGDLLLRVQRREHVDYLFAGLAV